MQPPQNKKTENLPLKTTFSAEDMPTLVQAAAPSRRRYLFSVLTVIVWIALLAFVVLNWRSIQDWWALRGYKAPASIAQLASQDTLTPYARKILYVNHPVIEDKASFGKSCPNNGGEQTIVLGCYHSDQNGIFLLNVTDTRLNGVEQVTAAHEMLHAAYDRLSTSERNWVNGQLLNYYHHDLHDQRLIQTIAAYQKSEPNDWVNELHSVFGTEVANLPSALENYYKRYFTNRAAVTTYATGYEAEFTTRQNEISADDAQLSAWLSQINSYKADLTTKQSQIEAARSALMSERNNPTAYNAAVPGYNALVDSYNSEVTTVQNLISQYNQLVNKRNAIALEEDQLTNDLSGGVPSTISN